MLAVVVRELSKHQSVSCLIVAFVIARSMSLSCYSSAKTRIRPVKLYHMHDSGESLDVSVCHTVNTTSPSACQSHDLFVCQPKCDSSWNSISPSVCPSSAQSIQPSAKFMTKICTSIAVCNFLNI